jgi:hypothetical protein
MTPPLLQLLRSVAKPRATDRLLKILVKSPVVALLQRFLGVLAANFKISMDHPRKIVQRRNRQQFPSKYQGLVCCSSVCNRAQQAHQAHQGI